MKKQPAGSTRPRNYSGADPASSQGLRRADRFGLTMRSNDDDTNGLDAANHDDFIQTVVHKWYDTVHRLTAAANYGTCESHDAWAYSTLTSRPSSAPNRSDSILVTSYVYDANSRLDTVTDPNGVVTKFTYDDLGRTVRTIEAYGESEARWTLTQYDGLSNVVKSIADIGKNDTFSGGVWTTDGDSQVTVYTHDDPVDASRVRQIQYPDGDTSDDNVKFTYALDGQVATRTAQKASGQTANVITYDYDTTFRRLKSERATTPGTLVDQTVLSISRTYDSLGRREFITSHNSASPNMDTFADAVNQVQYVYNAFGALDKEYQEHEGKVDGSTLHVDYAYDDATGTYNGITSVFTKGMRPKSIKYPNGRLVHYTYGTGGGLDDLLSRVAAIYNDNGSGSPGTTAYAAYKRAGDGRIVQEAFAEPDLKLTYIGAASGDYSGFDRFGRVVWQRWLKTDGSAADRYFYGYDRNSNRRWRAERSNASSAAGQRDEAYAYDRLNRLVGTKRGILPSGTYQAPYPGDERK